jgi:hypothetical protein
LRVACLALVSRQPHGGKPPARKRQQAAAFQTSVYFVTAALWPATSILSRLGPPFAVLAMTRIVLWFLSQKCNHVSAGSGNCAQV